MAADKKPKYQTATGYMLGGLRRHPGAIVFALILTLISSLLLTLPPVLVQMAVDEVSLHKQ